MISFNEAYDIIIKALKAIAGKATPQPKTDDTLSQLGIDDNDRVSFLRSQIGKTLASEGYEFQKMSLNEISPTTKVGELADIVKHAVPIKTPRMY